MKSKIKKGGYDFCLWNMLNLLNKNMWLLEDKT